MKKGILFSEIPTPTIVQKDDGGGKEIEAERKKLAGEFAEITRHPDADKVYIEMLDIVKETPIEGGVERIRSVWSEFFRDVRRNLEQARALLGENNPAPPDEGVSAWLDFLISNFKEIKWRDDAPKEMRDRAFELIVYYDKMKRARKTRAEFRALIDKGFEVLNSMRKYLNLEPF